MLLTSEELLWTEELCIEVLLTDDRDCSLLDESEVRLLAAWELTLSDDTATELTVPPPLEITDDWLLIAEVREDTDDTIWAEDSDEIAGRLLDRLAEESEEAVDKELDTVSPDVTEEVAATEEGCAELLWSWLPPPDEPEEPPQADSSRLTRATGTICFIIIFSHFFIILFFAKTAGATKPRTRPILARSRDNPLG